MPAVAPPRGYWSLLPSAGPLLAIDLGDVRIGIACSDPAQSVAHPVAVLSRRRGKRFPMRALQPHLEGCQSVGVLIGLPLRADGTAGVRATEARAVGALVARVTGLPVDYWDERMSTARVLAAQRETGTRPGRSRGDVDALAATVILQTFLDSRRP